MKRNSIARRTFLGSSLVTIGALEAEGAPAKKPQTRLAGKPQFKCNFDKDGRSKRVIFVAHCVLNQNARVVDYAGFPAMMKPLLAALQEKDIGIIQLPCPETLVLGLGRDRDIPPISIRDGLELPEAHVRLGLLIDQVIYQIKEYRYQGFHIVGILGNNTSPSCGVETSCCEPEDRQREGVFIRLLRERLRAEGLEIGFKGIDEQRQQEAIDWVSAHVRPTA
jgi:predicted secreted protein